MLHCCPHQIYNLQISPHIIPRDALHKISKNFVPKTLNSHKDFHLKMLLHPRHNYVAHILSESFTHGSKEDFDQICIMIQSKGMLAMVNQFFYINECRQLIFSYVNDGRYTECRTSSCHRNMAYDIFKSGDRLIASVDGNLGQADQYVYFMKTDSATFIDANIFFDDSMIYGSINNKPISSITKLNDIVFKREETQPCIDSFQRRLGGFIDPVLFNLPSIVCEPQILARPLHQNEVDFVRKSCNIFEAHLNDVLQQKSTNLHPSEIIEIWIAFIEKNQCIKYLLQTPNHQSFTEVVTDALNNYCLCKKRRHLAERWKNVCMKVSSDDQEEILIELRILKRKLVIFNNTDNPEEASKDICNMMELLMVNPYPNNSFEITLHCISHLPCISKIVEYQ